MAINASVESLENYDVLSACLLGFKELYIWRYYQVLRVFMKYLEDRGDKWRKTTRNREMGENKDFINWVKRERYQCLLLVRSKIRDGVDLEWSLDSKPRPCCLEYREKNYFTRTDNTEGRKHLRCRRKKRRTVWKTVE